MRTGLAMLTALFLLCDPSAFGQEDALGTLITFQIPVSYGSWQIEGQDDPHTGPCALRLPDGPAVIRGELGWAMTLNVALGNIFPRTITPGRLGRDLGGLLCYGTEVKVPEPPGRRLVLAIPKEAGAYAIPALLPSGTGHRAVHLPAGGTEIAGADWALTVTVADAETTAVWAEGRAPRDPEGTPLPPPTLAGDVLQWPATPKQPAPEVLALSLLLPKGRQVYRQDERIVTTLAAAAPQALTLPLHLAAERDGTSSLLVESPWGLPAGTASRTFEWSAALLTPGDYQLVATLGAGEATAEIRLRIAAVPPPTVPVIAAQTPDDAAQAVATQANAWMTRATLDASPTVHQQLGAAQAAGLQAWLVGQGAERLRTGRDTVLLAPLVARENALLVQQARTVAAYSGFVQGKIALGEQPAAVLTHLRQGAFLPEADLPYTIIATPPALAEHAAAAALCTSRFVDCRQTAPKDLAALFATAADQAAADTPLFVYTDSPAAAWQGLARGAAGLLIDSAEDEIASALRALSPCLLALGDPLPGTPTPELQLAPAETECHWATAGRQACAWARTPPGTEAITVTPPPRLPVVADLLGGSIAEASDRGEATLAIGERATALLALLPARPASLQTVVEDLHTAGPVPVLRCRAQLLDDQKRTVPTLWPATVRFERLAGSAEAPATLLAEVAAAFVDGVLEATVPLAANSPAGRYRATVTTAPGDLRGAAEAPYAPRARWSRKLLRERADLELEDRRIVSRIARSARAPWIIAGRAAHLPLARRLADACTTAGMEPRIALANEVLPRRFALPAGQPPVAGPAVHLPHTAFLLGTSADNPLIQLVTERHRLTPFAVCPAFPGPGRGLLMCSWRPFSVAHDAIVIGGGDVTGLALAVDHLVKLIAVP